MSDPGAVRSAVLFDLDDTLFDHGGAAAEAVARALPGADPARWARLTRQTMDRYLAGELTFAEQRRVRVRAFARESGLGEWDDARAGAWFAEYLARYEAAWRLFPDVGPALAALRRAGTRLGVVTNGDPAQQRAKLERLGLDAALSCVVISGEVGAAKPDPEIFRIACARLGLPPERVTHVGDRLDVDALAAESAGLRGVWLDRSGRAAPPGLTVERITSLRACRGGR
ncbi:HAD family hydrolase [Actinomadura kijaniata]|uniref:HAD family hydrolase n=1 Tax=Actinomadura kijaniata TaxID=46161 RepID=UPI000A8E4B63|nr:HAD family hydrolase [Actinomadura kijaniata]